MKTVPEALQTHLDGLATTTTRLLKIMPRSGTNVFGIAMCDRDIEYDDNSGHGSIVYTAANGFDATTFSSDTGYSVSNAEGFALISDEIDGLEAADVEAGLLDDAEWICYLVNFEDLTSGRHIVIDAGDIGEVRVRHGMVWLPELLSYLMRLKQPIGGVWSRTCRAIFGTPANSQTGCGVNITGLWRDGSIVSLGTEANRTFIMSIDSPGDSSPQVDSPDNFVPGRILFVTGNNTGKEFAIEEQLGDEISLIETTPYPMEVGDSFMIRPDCGKRYFEDCIGRWNNGPNFKGEPGIPVGDGISVMVPGAELGKGGTFGK